MIKKLFTSALIAVSALASSASAQNAISTELLAQPGIASQLEGIAQSSQYDNTTSGTPTSNAPNAANSSNIILNNDVLIQSAGNEAKPQNVVQEYFQILTGRTLEVYGASEFSQQQDNQLLFFNTIGQDYRLAPGDVLRVTLRGLSSSDKSYKIGNSGQLILPDLPPIPVSGLTISEVENRIRNSLQIDDASAAVFMSLETARLITVQVSGAVNQPRTLAVPAFTPLSRVLAYAGGVKPNGSLRNIVLRDRTGGISEIDFYDFLRSPAGSNDPVVTDSSRIFVPNQGSTVAAFGFVARPGIYELPTSQSKITVRDLLELSGTSILPPGVAIEAKYFNESGVSSTRKLKLSDDVSAGEVLNLRFVKTRLQQSITVTGAVLDEYSIGSSTPVSVQELLKGGSTVEVDAKLNFAIIIKNDGSVTAINLQQALSDPTQTVPVGSTLVIFDNDSYRNVLSADPISSDDPLVDAVSKADVIRVKLDNATVGLLPNTSSTIISEVINVLGLRPSVTSFTDLVLIEQQSDDIKPILSAVSLSNDFNSSLLEVAAINFWTNAGIDEYMLTANERDLRNLFQVTVPLFVDYELRALLSPSAANSAGKVGLRQNIGQAIYPLFGLVNSYNQTSVAQSVASQTLKELFNTELFNAGDQVVLFSYAFVENLISNKPDTISNKPDTQLRLANTAPSADQDVALQLEALTQTNEAINQSAGILEENLAKNITAQTRRINELNLTEQDIELLLSSTRIVSGAVQRPGGYPVAGDVTVEALLEVAGGALANADTSNIRVTFLSQVNRSLVKGKEATLELENPADRKKILAGRYFMEVPALINELVTGIVTVSGEVVRPGDYVIARNETIHDIIERAGGLTPVAYPLGAVLTRERIETQERDNNALLANQLEKAVLQVSSSGNENAAEQAKTILAYAQQLRAQPAVGRMSVNIISQTDGAPVYSQDGDTLFVPKRPSHVAVLGAVNKSSSAIYAPTKTLDAYLRSAGGATKGADLKRSYLLLPNGESTPLTRQLPIPPGAAIVIVPRTDKLSVVGITDLVSRVLGNIATSVLAINNVR